MANVNPGPALTANPNAMLITEPVNNQINPVPAFTNARRLLAVGRAINVNGTGDSALMQVINASVWAVTEVILWNASISLTTATYGIWTGAAGTGTSIVAASTALSGLTGPTVVGKPTVFAATLLLTQTAKGMYFNVNTAQGAVATVDCAIYGYDLT